MARRQGPSPYDGSPYAQGGQGYGYGAYDQGGAYGQSNAYGQDAYSQDAYGQGGDYAQGAYGYGQDPYGQDASPYAGGAQRGGYRQDSPYGQQGQAGGRSRGAAGGQGGRQQRAAGYPVGAGRTYESSRPSRVAGVRPVTAQDYARGSFGQGGGSGSGGGRGPKMDRRTLIACAGGAAAALALGAVGVTWFLNRAVACTVNGSPREAPRGSTAADLVKRGYAAPSAGNLVSIPDENGSVEVLEIGGGDPYTLTVNGEQVDPATYKLSDGDVLEFADGADVTEEVVQQNTEIPCGVQIPGDQWYLNTVGYVKQWGKNGVSTVETGTVSGRTYDRGVTQEPQDLIIDRAHTNPADGRLLVALTFDDGPSLEYTPQYLDILSRYGAKATFFNLGSNIEAGDEYRAMCKRCVDEGHQMASHTYSHDDITLTGMSDATRNAEIQDTFDAVANATGVATQVMRPPFGEFRGEGFLTYLRQQGDIAYSAYWTVDSLDWELPGVDQIVYNCTRGLSGDNYNGAVILMHDGGGNRDQDVQALPQIIETFQNAGYQFVTMNEMLQACGFPEWVYSGIVTRPEGAIVPDESATLTYIEYSS